MNEGLHTLRLGVSLGAIHDSAERYPPANCHPDTRKAVRQIILDWIHSENLASSFFWLYGPAGAGKTAILQAIAEFICSPSGSGQNFGGSFFFSRGKQASAKLHPSGWSGRSGARSVRAARICQKSEIHQNFKTISFL